MCPVFPFFFPLGVLFPRLFCFLYRSWQVESPISWTLLASEQVQLRRWWWIDMKVIVATKPRSNLETGVGRQFVARILAPGIWGMKDFLLWTYVQNNICFSTPTSRHRKFVKASSVWMQMLMLSWEKGATISIKQLSSWTEITQLDLLYSLPQRCVIMCHL